MQYIIILNDDGSKHTAFALGVQGDTIEELRALAETEYPDKKYIEGDSLINNALGEQRSRWDGEKVVVDPLPEPTPAEVEAKRVADLNTERAGYEEELHQRLKIAELQGNEELIASIRDEYAAMNAAYVEALKGDEA